ncbi:hypothetical protein LIP_1360 [Limnochorda pilosa]|uniref:Glycerophosphoryl diester phosphodiesterase membrane domain-containing protein n=1 Tax=Limnochorda pilosa TaxID=1555112 RepID=A0A0K2SJB6_LIMPI|nr:hypothetical protein LIP_1360 [Limnochorda pilosa]
MGPSSSRLGGGPLGTGHLGRDPFAFGVGALLGRAWELLRPDLLKHVGFLVTLVLLELILVGMAEAVKSSLLVLFLSLVAAIVGSLLASGHLLAALERASGLTPTFGDFFGVRHRALTVVFAMWLQALIPQLSGLLLLLFAWLLSLTGGDVGVLVFFVAGVWLMLYLGFGYMITIPLVLDQNLSPWRALTTSARALRGRRLTVLGVLAVLFLINVLGALPFGLGLLVTAPLGPTAIVAVYEALFGITGRLPGRRSTLASSWSPPLR